MTDLRKDYYVGTIVAAAKTYLERVGWATDRELSTVLATITGRRELGRSILDHVVSKIGTTTGFIALTREDRSPHRIIAVIRSNWEPEGGKIKADVLTEPVQVNMGTLQCSGIVTGSAKS